MIEPAFLFETPLLIASLSDATQLNADLRATIVRQKGVGADRAPRRSLWTSDNRMLEWGGDAVRTLLETVLEIADQHSDPVEGERGRFVWAPQMRAIALEAGGHEPARVAAGAFWSVLYVVDDGYAGSADRRLGGEVEYEDPRHPLPLMEAPDLRIRLPGGKPLGQPHMLLRPSTGSLLMAPGWLRRATLPFNGAGRTMICIDLFAMPVD